MELVEVLQEERFRGPGQILGTHGLSETQHGHEAAEAQRHEKISQLFFH